MAAIERFEDILAWQAARDLKEAFSKVVLESRSFTKRSLIDQLERSADSSMANIAEGFDAGSDAEFIRFLRIAKRSATEFQSHLYSALGSRQITKSSFDELYEHARKTKGLIGGFIRYLEWSLASKKSRTFRRKHASNVRRGTDGGRRTRDRLRTVDRGR